MNHWVRVTHEKPCPVCGKPDWCLVSKDGAAIICPRIQQGSKREIEGSGYLHVVKETKARPALRLITPPKDERCDFTPINNQFRANLQGGDMEALSVELGISIDTLDALGLGITQDGKIWTFPMYDDFQTCVGIRMRGRDGSKWAAKGSRNGLFAPAYWSPFGTVLICEGPTDTGAGLDMGYMSIGRPSCNSGADWLIPYVEDQSVVIVADQDRPGQEGAAKLAQELYGFVQDLRVITPTTAKDLREWKRSGGSKKVLDAVIEATPFYGEMVA